MVSLPFLRSLRAQLEKLPLFPAHKPPANVVVEDVTMPPPTGQLDIEPDEFHGGSPGDFQEGVEGEPGRNEYDDWHNTWGWYAPGVVIPYPEPQDSVFRSYSHFRLRCRCRLCRFPLATGDRIRAFYDGQSYHVVCTRDETMAYAEFGVRIAFVHECASAWTGDGGDYVYHEHCKRLLNDAPKIRGLSDARYSFMPTVQEDRRRWTRVHAQVQKALPGIMPHVQLPAEVWGLVAEHLVPLYAACAEAQLWERRGGRSCTDQLQLRLGVRAYYTYIDGVRYVQRLTTEDAFDEEEDNSAHDGFPGAPTMFEPAHSETSRARASSVLLYSQKASDKTHIYVLENHVGVRQLVFASADRRPPGLPTYADMGDGDGGGAAWEGPTRAWWRTITFQRNTASLSIRADAVKVRAVEIRSDETGRDGPPLWPVPMSAGQLASTPWHMITEGHGYDRADMSGGMHSFVCNDAAVTGYAAVVAGKSVRGIYAHRAGGDDAMARVYRDADAVYGFRGARRASWLYFPVAPDERIVHVYKRYRASTNHRGVLCRTSRGRAMNFSRALLRSDQRQRWSADWELLEHIDAAAGPTRIFYGVRPGGGDGGIECLAVAHTTVADFAPALHPPRRLTRMGAGTQYFCQQASLRNVARITLCREQGRAAYNGVADERCVFVTGLLFEYLDDQPPACIGEYRLDRAGAPIDAMHSAALRFGYSAETKNLLLRVDVGADGGAAVEDGLAWVTMPWRGLVEMWFAAAESEVFHMDAEQRGG